MRKKLFWGISAAALLIVGVLCCIVIPSNLKINQKIIRISIHNGDTGETIDVTDSDSIDEIIKKINSLNLKRKYRISPKTGWEIFLGLYSSDDKMPKIISLKPNGMEYNDYFYGENIDTNLLLNSLKGMF